MAESYVRLPPDSTGKKLRSFEHTVGADSVHAHALGLVEPATGTPINAASEETLEAVRALLAAEDFSSQTTLEAIRVLLAGEDFAQEANQATRHTALMAEIDGLEEAVGTTADLDTASTVIGRLKKLIALFDAEDFASETTLDALRDRFGAVTQVATGAASTSLAVSPSLALNRTKFDFAGGVNPKYIGVAAMGTATGTAGWTVFRFLYDADGNVEDIQALDAVAWGANTAARDALSWSA